MVVTWSGDFPGVLLRLFKITRYLVDFLTRITDPGSGSGIRNPVLFDPWIRDPVWVNYRNPDPGFRIGMNNPAHISGSLETIFWLKYLNSLMRIRDGKNSDPGWKNSDPGSGSNIPDQQHCNNQVVCQLQSRHLLMYGKPRIYEGKPPDIVYGSFGPKRDKNFARCRVYR